MRTIIGLAVTCVLPLAARANTLSYPNGDAGDWPDPVTHVATGGPNGGAYTEIHNVPDSYAAGYGGSEYSFYGVPGGWPGYVGPFSQSVAIYIDANWAPAAVPSTPSFWLDMTPYHADPNNYGAEHNFQFTATGSQVNVSVDGSGSSLAAITYSGWSVFQMTYRKAANLSDPVITDMNVYNPLGQLIATDEVFATSPGGPFPSSDLAGSGYVWFTVWQNGFADNTLKVANLVTTGVPDRGATLVLLALGLAGIGGVRRCLRSVS